MKEFFRKVRESRWRYVIGGLIILVGIILFLLLPVGPGTVIILFGVYVINCKWINDLVAKITAWIKSKRRKKNDDDNDKAP